MKRLLFRVTALSLGLAFALGCSELTLRLWPPPWLRLRMSELRAREFQEPGTDRGWPIRKENGQFLSFSPSSRFTISHYEYRHSADIDELGTRVVPAATSAAEIVPFVGDSFVFGIRGVSERLVRSGREAKRRSRPQEGIARHPLLRFVSTIETRG